MKFIGTASTAILLTACGPEVIVAPERAEVAEPEVLAASVACETSDDGAHWVFLAEVADDDGDDDILAVHAYIYDEVTDVQVANYPLLRGDDAGVWEARLPAPDTSLNCDYQSYSVDFLATDADGNTGVTTAWTTLELGS